MRRYLVVVLIFMLFVAYFQVSNYQVRDGFFLEFEGYVKDLRYSSSGYMVYVDDVVVSNFGEVSSLRLGDKVLVSGEALDVLSLDNSGFAYYLKGRGCSYIVNFGQVSVVESVKDRFSFRFSFLSWMDEKLDRLYGQYSFFPKALLYGYSLDKELLESFRLSGTSHILALSGFHVGFIVLFFNVCFLVLGVGIRKRYAFIGALLVFYTFATGCRPSILRSVAFFFFYYGAFLCYGRFDTLSASMAIASFMLALNTFVVFDMGFVLSFLCVCSIFMFYPMVDGFVRSFVTFRLRGWSFYVYNLVLVTVAAQVLALPYMAFSFGRVAVLSIFANVLILPLVSLLMGVIVLSLLFCAFFPLARLLADLGVIIVDVILAINDFISGLSFASWDVSLGPLGAFVFSFLLIGCFVVFELWRIKENRYEL